MSECVVRMEMPHDGLCDLAFSFLDRTCCTIEGNLCNYCDDGVIPKWCPILCQLPEWHGRLVDVAVLKNKNMRKPRGVSSYDYGAMATVFMDMINDTPTIVPAEGSKE